jgi:hypothetical protein
MLLKIKEKKKEYAIYVVFAIFLLIPICVLITSPDGSLRLLALSVAAAILGVIVSMLSFFRSSEKQDEIANLKRDELNKKEEEIGELKKANILKEKELEVLKSQITQTREIEEQRRKDERELPKIEVLNVKSSTDFINLHVKNVGAKGKVTATVENHSRFIVRWFKGDGAIKGAVGEKEKKLERGEECNVVIRRPAVPGTGQKMSYYGFHYISLRFPETDQIFKCKFSITEEGIKDFGFLGEEDE